MKIEVGKLKFSDELLSLRPINPYFVSRYRLAMRNGDVFPKIIINKATKEIICGNHRAKAYIDEFGEDYILDVEVRDFTDESSIIKCFALDNSKHGEALTDFQRRSIALKLSNLGTTPEEIAKIFGVAVKNVFKWGEQSVFVVGNAKTSAVPTPISSTMGESLPIKGGLDNIQGKSITEKQYVDHRQNDVGISDKRLAEQLIRHLKADWIDFGDEGIQNTFKELYQLIGKRI